MKKIVAVICDDIDGECVLATQDDFVDKHIWVRQKVGEHKLPAKNVRGDIVSETYNGWTDDQTLVITNLTQKNLKKAQRQGYKIPKELLTLKRKQKRKKKKATPTPPLAGIWNLPDDRYAAIEDIRKILKFGKQEWKTLLHALSKTDNGWLQYMQGDILIRFAKVVDIDELRLDIEQNKKGKISKTVTYTYDLNEFKQTKTQQQ